MTGRWIDMGWPLGRSLDSKAGVLGSIPGQPAQLCVLALLVALGWACPASAQNEQPGAAPLDLAGSMLFMTYSEWSVRVGRPRSWKHCRRAPDGCEARMRVFATYLREAGMRYDIDPWLLAGMAFQESRLNPSAVGRGGERGVLQLHPARGDVRRLRFFRNDRYRKRCLESTSACQRPIVMMAAKILRRAINWCGGDVVGGLAAYNAGRCDHPRGLKYARIVHRWKRKMRSIGGDA